MPSVNTAETENMATVTFGSSLIFYNVRDGASCSAPPQVYAPSLSPRMEIHRKPSTNQNHGCFLQVMFSSLCQTRWRRSEIGRVVHRNRAWTLLSDCINRHLGGSLHVNTNNIQCFPPSGAVNAKSPRKKLLLRFCKSPSMICKCTPCGKMTYCHAFFLLDHFLLAGMAADFAPPGGRSRASFSLTPPNRRQRIR